MKKMKNYLILCSLMLTGSMLLAQSQNVGIGTTTPAASAALEIEATDKGLLIPRMDSTARKAISSPAEGLMVFDSTYNVFYYYANSAWQEVGAAANSILQVQNGIVYSGSAVDISNDDFVFGSDQLNDDGDTNHHARFFFDKSKSAFRAGKAEDASWDEDSLGESSIALGYNTRATGNASTAMGIRTVASAYAGTAAGNATIASGVASTALGSVAEASGFSSTAMGAGTKASGANSTAMGTNTEASGAYSTTIGHNTTAPSAYEVTLGLYNTEYTPESTTSFSTADRLFSIGNGTNSFNPSDALVLLKSGNMGLGTSTPDTTLHLVGQFKYEDGNQEEGYVLTTNSSGEASWQKSSPFQVADDISNYDFVFGSDQLDDDGDFEHDARFFFDKSAGSFRAGSVNGDGWDAGKRGNYSVAMGHNTEASGEASVAVGDEVLASGIGSIALGYQTTASAQGAVALGYNNDANGQSSIVLGNGVIAESYGEVAVGIFNTEYTPQATTSYNSEDRVFVVGNGSSALASGRSDAMVILKNGNVGFGTSSPDTTLHVLGKFKYDDDNQANGYVLTSDADGVASWQAPVIDTDTDDQTLSLSGSDLSISEGNTVDLSVIDQQLSLSGSNLSISNANTVDLSAVVADIVADEDSDTKIQLEESANEDHIRFDVAGNQVMVLNSSGHLGVGTDAPDTTLHLVGQFKYEDGNQSNDYVLTSDANGVASWQAPVIDTDTDDQTLSLSGSDLSISEGNTVDLSVIDQQLSLSGSNLSISNANTVDLSAVVADIVADEDSDTKIQLEESANEDHIRFDVAGNQVMVLNSSGHLGVGTDAPDTTLHLVGQFKYEDGNQSDGYVLTSDADGHASWQPTLNEVFDVSGGVVQPGSAVAIESDDFVFGSTQLDDREQSNYDSRFFFDKSAGSFRAGSVNGDGWDAGKRGNYSVAMGHNTEASGEASVAVGDEVLASGIGSIALGYQTTASAQGAVALGYNNDANGQSSIALGNGVIAESYGEVAVGIFNTEYTPQATTSYNSEDRVFVVGNGSSALASGRSDAMVILKNGNVGFGTSSPDTTLHVLGKFKYDDDNQANGYVLTSDANGVASWQAPVIDTDTDTDDQTLSLSGSDLSISEGNTVDLSAVVADIVADEDGDTKIQLEESTDEDIIRFDVAGTEAVTIDNSGYVGIGTSSPDARLNLLDSNRADLTLQILDNDAEQGIAFQNSGGAYSWNIYRTPNGNNSSDLRFAGAAVGSSKFQITDLNEYVTFQAGGNVGIGVTNPSYALQVGSIGDGTEARANAWNTFSDRRWKKDFEIIPDALKKLNQVNGYFYNWKEGIDTTQQVGVIAQEIEEILPQAVSTDENGYKSVDYSKLTAWLIQVNKEQQDAIARQQAIIEQQASDIALLKKNEQEENTTKAELESLKAAVEALQTKMQNKTTASVN
jgi:hypothetical protein